MMSETLDPTRPTPDTEKFKPKNVADDDAPGRADRNMHDVPRGSEEDRRRSSTHRVSDQG